MNSRSHRGRSSGVYLSRRLGFRFGAIESCIGCSIDDNGRPPRENRSRDRFGVETQEVDGMLRLERRSGHEFVPQLIEAAPGLVDSISVGKPTLEDVFIQLTGQRFRDEPAGQIKSAHSP